MPAMPLKLAFAVKALQRGGVIAYPTEAVWGLGCDPHNNAALRRLLMMKQRDPAKGLILVAADRQQFAPYLAGLEPALLKKLDESWPGPNTWLVPDNGVAPALVRGSHRSVALRVSAHSLVGALCTAFGGPIVSTSANLSGEPAVKHIWQLMRRLGDRLDYCLPGATGGHRNPSLIRDLLTDEVIRPS